MKKSLLFAMAVAVGLGTASGADAQQLRFMTGPQGGSWYPLGGAIQNMAANELGTNIIVMPGGGVANIQGVQGGQADLGFGNSISTVDAVNGRKPFDGKADNVCNLATLYPQYFQMITIDGEGVDSVADFKGRRLVTQPVGNTAEQVIRTVLDVGGMSYDDMDSVDYVSYSDGVSLMQDGNADIFTLGTTVPASSIMDLANSRKIQLVPLDDEFIAQMRERNPGFAGLTVPGGSYPNQDEDVQVVGYATHLVARCDLDPEVVKGVLEVMWKNVGDLQAIAGAMKGLTVEKMAQDNGVPMHEGAKLFYKEHGAM
ncbi:TAXI family TRAP transporter solute-binding subunit [Kaustia mangrovi]|uniref:TAXI family TRAP transporter solute-binding subunit n=1 Tax=Kaustia mangrovi TaxID=2593653 RepID=A0A7S8HBE4_9HYPH|nr:TAXI family TRAP transporter solute-binding subunit [Kaustia mangrovi]QPC42406.1 TAXI family TRAP transporter solute-binding subunit [Kaustia mangrovi]